MTAWHGREPDIRCEFGAWTEHRCSEQAASGVSLIGLGRHSAALCERHATNWPGGSRSPLIRDPRIAACVVGAITGATPPVLAELLRAGCLDPVMLEVALDFVEQHGLTEPGAWPRGAGVEWPKVGRHEHAWLPYVSGGPPAIGALFRCPCGRFSNGHNAGRYPDGRRIVDVNGDGLGVPGCLSPGCQREAGHRGLHMARHWDSQAGQEIVDEWGDVGTHLDDRADALAYAMRHLHGRGRPG